MANFAHDNAEIKETFHQTDSPQLNKKLHNTENIKIVKKPQIIFEQV